MIRLLFLLVVVIPGCATLEQRRFCDVIPDVRIPILHPDQYADAFIRSQLVKIESRQEQFQFLSQLEVQPNKLILVALTPIGQKLFQIQYLNGTIEFEKFGLPVNFDPAYLVADIGLIYAKEQGIVRCLSDQGISLRVQHLSHDKRVFVDEQQQKITINYQKQDQFGQERIDLQNERLEYRIIINTIEYHRL